MGRKPLKAGRTAAVPDVASAGVTILPGRPMPEWLVPAAADPAPDPTATALSAQTDAAEAAPQEIPEHVAQAALVTAGASAAYADSPYSPAAPSSYSEPPPAYSPSAPAPSWTAAPTSQAAPVTAAAPAPAQVAAPAAAPAGQTGAGYSEHDPEPYAASARYAPSPAYDSGTAFAPNPVYGAGSATAPSPASAPALGYAPDQVAPAAPVYPPGASYGLHPDLAQPGTSVPGEHPFDPHGSTDLSAPPAPAIPGSWDLASAPTPTAAEVAAGSAVAPGSLTAEPVADLAAEPMSAPAVDPSAPSAASTIEPGAPATELTPQQVAVLARLADLLVRGEYPPLPETAGLGNPPTSPFDTDYIPAPPPRPEARRRSSRTGVLAVVGAGAVALVAAGVMFGPGLIGSLTAQEPAPVTPATLTMPTAVGDLVALTGDAATNELVPVFGLGYRPTGVTTTSAYASAADAPMALGAMATTLPPSADAAGQIMMWASRMGATTDDPVTGTGATAGITCADATGLPAASDGAFCVWSATGDRGQTYVVGTSAKAALDSTASFVTALNGSPASATS